MVELEDVKVLGSELFAEFGDEEEVEGDMLTEDEDDEDEDKDEDDAEEGAEDEE